jgi:hypothetical protein
MITKEEKMEIFVKTISHLRKKFISNKELDVQRLEKNKLAEKYRKLPLA